MVKPRCIASRRVDATFPLNLYTNAIIAEASTIVRASDGQLGMRVIPGEPQTYTRRKIATNDPYPRDQFGCVPFNDTEIASMIGTF